MKQAFELDNGVGADAAIGLIVLQADETIEQELRSVFSQPGVALYHARIPSAPTVTPQTLLRMERDLPHTAALLPAQRPLDVVGYACTSGATLIGPERVAAAINRHHPQALVTDPLTAVIAALRALEARRIGFVTPYVAEVSEAMRSVLENLDIHVRAFVSFAQEAESVVARITETSVLEAICACGASDTVDAVFVSCTNLRSFNIIDKAENRIGKPVVTSNQALAWHMLGLARLPVLNKGPGRLFSQSLPQK